jgi:hypothetical protein
MFPFGFETGDYFTRGALAGKQEVFIASGRRAGLKMQGNSKEVVREFWVQI